MYVFAIIGMELFSVDVTSEIHDRAAMRDNTTLSSQCGTYWNLGKSTSANANVVNHVNHGNQVNHVVNHDVFLSRTVPFLNKLCATLIC